MLSKVLLMLKKGNPYSRRTADYHDVVAPYFDEDFYVSNNKDISISANAALNHYLTVGWLEGRDPSANFSTSSYLSRYADVRLSGFNPLVHYVLHGQKEGRSGGVHSHGISVLELSVAVDNLNADSLSRLPGEDINSSIAGSPRTEVKQHNAVIVADSENSTIANMLEGSFDRTFYLSRYPDVAQANIDALTHYCGSGWRELRDPSPDFSTRYYLDSNPDVRDAGINPFFHFLIAGKEEGRAPTAPGGYKAQIISQIKNLDDLAESWLRPDPPRVNADYSDLKKAILQIILLGRRQLVVSISHDDYRRIPGGVQLCIQREEQLAARYEASYLHLRPSQALPYLARGEDSDPAVTATLDGVEVGSFVTSDVTRAIESLSEHDLTCQVVVHHMLGHSPERIGDMINRVAASRSWLWLHDFFSLCPSYALQRNMVTFCGAPPTNSNSCSMCVYGEERANHLSRMNAFQKTVRPHVISPSKVTADFWLSKSPHFYASLTVLPHMKLDWFPRADRADREHHRAVRVAFLGTPAPHKGWDIFSQLVRRQKGAHYYQFFYFGTGRASVDGVIETEVTVSASEMESMISAVSDSDIDFVIHWASWPETFSFSTFEALAGGAYVITNSGSGNVAATVETTKKGVILENEEDLIAFFESGLAQELALKVREERKEFDVRLQWSKMSFELLKKL